MKIGGATLLLILHNASAATHELIWNNCYNVESPCDMTVAVGDKVNFTMVGNSYPHNIYKVADATAYTKCDYSGATEILDGPVQMQGMDFNGVMAMKHVVAFDSIGMSYYVCNNVCGVTYKGTATANGYGWPSEQVIMEPGKICDACHCTGSNQKVKITVVAASDFNAAVPVITYPKKTMPRCWAKPTTTAVPVITTAAPAVATTALTADGANAAALAGSAILVSSLTLA